MRVAVVGSGISGLAAAWFVGRTHEVTLYERHARPGMGVHGLDLGLGPRAGRVDVPLRVFHPPYYPTLTALYRALGVDTEAVDYSASFSTLAGRTYFRYGNVRVAGRTLSLPRGLRVLGPAALRLVAGAARYYATAPRDLRRGALSGRTIGEYLASRRLTRDFGERLLVPALAGIATCTFERAHAYPADVVVDYTTRGGLFWGARRAVHGTDDVVARLTRPVAHARYGSRIEAIEPGPDRVLVREAGRDAEAFDHVVIAAPANRALAYLRGGPEAAVLAGFSYVKSRVVVHRDARLMPARRADWAPVSFFVPGAGDAGPGATRDAPMATIWLNAVQPDLRGREDVFQTWSPLVEPAPETVLGAADFERPVVDRAAEAARDALGRLHAEPGRRLWLCGSYAGAGIPLLESGVASAARVARALGCREALAVGPA